MPSGLVLIPSLWLASRSEVFRLSLFPSPTPRNSFYPSNSRSYALLSAHVFKDADPMAVRIVSISGIRVRAVEESVLGKNDVCSGMNRRQVLVLWHTYDTLHVGNPLACMTESWEYMLQPAFKYSQFQTSRTDTSSSFPPLTHQLLCFILAPGGGRGLSS